MKDTKVINLEDIEEEIEEPILEWLCPICEKMRKDYHCPVCKLQPPWGCDCTQCFDRDYEPEDYYEEIF